MNSIHREGLDRTPLIQNAALKQLYFVVIK